MELLIFREELNKKQKCSTNHNCHAMFSAKGSKEYAGIIFFIFEVWTQLSDIHICQDP